jgi:nitrate/nitrite-specific signal transduction histidine kinase
VRTRAVPADSTAPRQARRFVADAIPSDLTMVAQLLVSEVVSTCIRHEHADDAVIEIAVQDVNGSVRVDVALRGIGHSVQVDETVLEETGIGLEIMNALAYRWGVERDPSEWRGWFELRADFPYG